MNKKIIIKGIVQGVGFRPFIYKIAKKNKIKGYIKNSSSGVIIEIESSQNNINNFIQDIKTKKPKQSLINTIEIKNNKLKKFFDFKILKSDKSSKRGALIPVDLAICKNCIKDINSKNNRRYNYPFTNCTDCGPRFSIIKKIPYDRPFTTMSEFKMCSDCLKEYRDPVNRRFHAQPNACKVCGPDVWLFKDGEKVIGENALNILVKEISKGKVCAIKGLGGFHIACDAYNEESVKKLRKFKDRERKPFAIMVDEIKDLKDKIFINKKEEILFNSQKAPIIMFKKKTLSFFNLSSPNISTIGIMKPYTPLHKIIFKKLKEINFKNPLIMTSGNFRDEPIIKDNEKAKEIFKKLDLVLYHNRDIYNRIDDSLVFIDSFKNERIIRRARGYVPDIIEIPIKSKENLLSAGADIKNSFALSYDNKIFMSQYIGDLEDGENKDFYIESIKKMGKLFSIKPKKSILDLHPNYYSSIISKKLAKKNFYVQHHIAHISSVMAEYGLKEDVLGVSFDGTGYGLDGNIWGGEFFIIKNKKVERFSHIKYFNLPGGEICSKEVWRTLFSLFYNLNFKEDKIFSFFKKDIKKENIEIIYKMLKNNFNLFKTSSAGRLFDAFSSLIIGENKSTYEAELPMRLESLVLNKTDDYYDFEVIKENENFFLDYKKALLETLSDSDRKVNKNIMAEKFHRGISLGIINMLLKMREITKINKVCFSGGVFQNKVLIDFLHFYLKKYNFEFYFNSRVPTNDSGISLGQIYYHILGLNFKNINN